MCCSPWVAKSWTRLSDWTEFNIDWNFVTPWQVGHDWTTKHSTQIETWQYQTASDKGTLLEEAKGADTEVMQEMIGLTIASASCFIWESLVFCLWLVVLKFQLLNLEAFTKIDSGLDFSGLLSCQGIMATVLWLPVLITLTISVLPFLISRFIIQWATHFLSCNHHVYISSNINQTSLFLKSFKTFTVLFSFKSLNAHLILKRRNCLPVWGWCPEERC